MRIVIMRLRMELKGFIQWNRLIRIVCRNASYTISIFFFPTYLRFQLNWTTPFGEFYLSLCVFVFLFLIILVSGIQMFSLKQIRLESGR